MILLKELKINNFLSHETTNISFNQNEKILLDGKSGGGKSSIIESIIWCLYGHGRSENKTLVRRGQKSASVTLKFSNGEQETVITRTVSNAGKNTLTVTQNTGSQGQFIAIQRTGIKEIQEWIEKEFIKASYELFTNSIAYPQDSQGSFVKATAGERKDLLLEIIRAGNFDELYEKTRKLIQSIDINSAVSVSKREALEASIKRNQEIVDKKDEYTKELNTCSAELESLTLVEKDIENDLNGISQLSAQIQDKKKMRSIVAVSIEKIDAQINKDANTIDEHNKTDISTARASVEEFDVIASDIATIEKDLKENAINQQQINAHLANRPMVFDYSLDIESINARLIPLVKETCKCPAGDDCPFILPVKGQIDYLTEQLTLKKQKSIQEAAAFEDWDNKSKNLPIIKDVTEHYKRLQELRDKLAKLNEYKNIVSKYDSFATVELPIILERTIQSKTEKEQLLQEVDRLDSELKTLEQKYTGSDINSINSKLSSIRISKSEIQKKKDSAALNLNLATNAEVAIKDSSTELVELQASLKNAVEEKESLELLKEALSPRGIKAVVIDYVIPQLEDKINNILGQLSDFRIRLDTQQSKTKEEEGVKEGLFIFIKNPEGEELPFANLSGGESIKVSMAISEGLASLSNVVGFRLLDECINALDNESTSSFVEVLLKLQEKFPQVLCVSHLQEVKDVFEKKINIIKLNGISKIN